MLDSKPTEAGKSLLATYSDAVVVDGYQIHEILPKPAPEGGSASSTRSIASADPRPTRSRSGDWVGKLRFSEEIELALR